MRVKNFPKRYKLTSTTDFGHGQEVVRFADWFADGRDEYLTNANTTVAALMRKVRENSVNLGEIADVQRGVTPFHLSDKSTHPNCRRAFAGTVRRYKLDPGPIRYIRFDDTLAEFKPERYFIGPRLLLRELISRQFRLQAMKVVDDFITNKSMQTILATTDAFPLDFLLGCINSRLMSWYFLTQSNVANRDDFPKIVLKETRGLPIPKRVATSSEERRQAQLVSAAVEILLGTGQNGRRGSGLNTSELEREIDDRVYRLYGLTPDEIKIVEESGGERAPPFP